MPRSDLKRNGRIIYYLLQMGSLADLATSESVMKSTFYMYDFESVT